MPIVHDEQRRLPDSEVADNKNETGERPLSSLPTPTTFVYDQQLQRWVPSRTNSETETAPGLNSSTAAGKFPVRPDEDGLQTDPPVLHTPVPPTVALDPDSEQERRPHCHAEIHAPVEVLKGRDGQAEGLGGRGEEV